MDNYAWRHEMRNIGSRGVVRKWKIYIGILLFCLILGVGIYHSVDISSAATVTVGTVNTDSSNLNVRSGPGTTYSTIGSLAKGAQVTILGEENGWYKIQYGSGTGYVSKDYISNVHDEGQPDTPGTTVDPEYVQKLINDGFPSSYATMLASLHSQYPNWVFEPVKTGLDWNTVIEKESVLGVNLVQSTNNDAQKSTAAGAYDWTTNKWVGKDGAGWVCASPDMIRYCIDPRNFLDAENIFQFATSDFKEYQNADGVKALVSGSFLINSFTDTDGVLRNYPDIFVDVGRQVGVSPYHLASRCRQEQGTNGTSGSISGTVSGYTGYFNYFNVGAYATGNLTAVQKGLQYAKEQGWNSRYKSILGGATVVGNNYVKLGQNTGYFEKFNVVNKTSGLYGHQYMTNVQAAISEGKNTKKAYTDNSAAIVFRIPVYDNMPETACAMPKSGNPNNWIKSLTVSGYNMTPAFNGSVTEYSLIVGENISSVTISGTPVASTSRISGTGTINLNYGTNMVTINCTAENQSVRTYTLNIVRQGSASGIRGDVDGDGSITLADWVAIKRHILNYAPLTGTSAQAADVDGDGSITLADWVAVKRHILGYESLN